MEKLVKKTNLDDASSVFEEGKDVYVDIKVFKPKKKAGTKNLSPPWPLLVASPTTSGTYPVLLFFHGFMLSPADYTSLFRHISSHRYIVVAPEFSSMVSTTTEVKNAAKVTEWFIENYNSVLPEKVHPDLQKLALSGHSRGGKTAFTLAIDPAKYSTSPSKPLNFQALVGVDPVAGPSISSQVDPKILKWIPHCFDQTFPVAVIGGGLSNQRAGWLNLMPPAAPDGVNHSEFFNESKPPCYYFLAKDYGHTDMLNDNSGGIVNWVCKSGKGPKKLMRRAVGGIVVAFLEAYLGGQDNDLNAIVETPSLAPTTLDPVIKCV